MLNCRDIAARASEHLDGDLRWHQSLGYGMHLLVCGHCRQFLRHLRITIAYTRALPEHNALEPDALEYSDAERIVEHTLNPISRP